MDPEAYLVACVASCVGCLWFLAVWFYTRRRTERESTTALLGAVLAGVSAVSGSGSGSPSPSPSPSPSSLSPAIAVIAATLGVAGALVAALAGMWLLDRTVTVIKERIRTMAF